MPYENLLADAWSKDLAVAEQDTSFLAELIYGHLIHHFSDSETFSSWPKNAALRIHNTLRYTAQHKRKVAPSCALSALLIVVSMADDPKLKEDISLSHSAEVLWVVAFKALAADRGQKFTMGEYTLAVRPRDGVNQEWFDTAFHHTPSNIRPYLKQALTRRRRRMDSGKVVEMTKYWLAPWEIGAHFAGGPMGTCAESPAMGTHTVYHPRALSRPIQLMVQLPVSHPDTYGKLDFPTLIKDYATTGGAKETQLDVNSTIESCSFDTNSSYLDSLADDYSFATTATSLTSIGDAAGPGNLPISPLPLSATYGTASTLPHPGFLVVVVSINTPSIPFPATDTPPQRRAVWDPNYVSPHKGERLRFWTNEGYWVEGVNFKYTAFGGYDYGPPILGVSPRGPCHWEKPVPFQPSPEHAAWMAKRAKRQRFFYCMVRPWTWIGDRRKAPPEAS